MAKQGELLTTLQFILNLQKSGQAEKASLALERLIKDVETDA